MWIISRSFQERICTLHSSEKTERETEALEVIPSEAPNRTRIYPLGHIHKLLIK